MKKGVPVCEPRTPVLKNLPYRGEEKEITEAQLKREVIAFEERLAIWRKTGK
jgi:hypothetical protein